MRCAADSLVSYNPCGMTHRLRQLLPPSSKGSRERLVRILPLLLLLTALSTLFLFGNLRGYLYRPGIHNWNSTQNLTLAENLSPSHNFRLFFRLHPREDGVPVYVPYSRFPIGGYVLMKLAIVPFGDDLSAKILAGRIMMLLLFGAAAVLAYLSLCRLISNRWIALTATLLAFSSYYMLYFSDMISNEVTMDLFAVMLTFHGMIIFVQEGRFRQLLIKTCAALLLGWHVYAFVAPFVLLGVGWDVLRAHSSVSTEPIVHRVKRIGTTLLGSRSLMLGIVALLFGMVVLGFNFANEYTALNGETPLPELPSVQSMLTRVGLNEEYRAAQADTLSWGPFLTQQFRRIGRMFIPLYALWGHRSTVDPLGFPTILIVGITATVACLVGLVFGRPRILLATLALSGFFWAIPMRHTTAIHDLESVFYVGVSLVLSSLALLYANKLLGSRVVAVFAAAALLIFAGSVFQNAHARYDTDAVMHNTVMDEFEAIREATRGKSVFVTSSWESTAGFAGSGFAVDYYLSGSLILYDDRPANRERGTDFIISRYRDDRDALITPENQMIFLYESADALDLYRSEYRSVVSENHAARSNFDVYLRDGKLTYIKESCKWDDTRATFFLHVNPFDESDLPPERRQYGFDNLDFLFYPHAFTYDRGQFQRSGKIFDGKCMVTISLPSYQIRGTITGQFDDSGGIWSVDFPVDLDIDAYRSRYDAIATGDPIARSVFEVYLGEDELTYFKASCSEADTQPRFFLHITPLDQNDLPRDREQHGFNNLDFAFDHYGLIFDGKCLATVPLPNYLIDKISTGQFADDAQLWNLEFPVRP